MQYRLHYKTVLRIFIMLDQIQWLGHGSFVIQGPPLIYIDPWRVVRSAFHADAILVSHDHYEHCSQADINKLRGKNTVVIGNAAVAEQVENTTQLRPWHTMTIDRAAIKAVPAYTPDDAGHAKSAGGLGFIVSLNYYDIYYAGGTGIIPEMERIHPDIAILPIDGSGGVLNVEQAAEAVKQLGPRYVIPCNWGTLAGGATLIDAQEFKERVADRAEVIIPTRRSEA